MIWFTSDLHLGHGNVIKYCNRPFGSKEEMESGVFSKDTVLKMNDTLVSNWNNIVNPADEIYCLGDISLGIKTLEEYSSRLNGKKYLVPGNHDYCHSYHKKSRTHEKREAWILKYLELGWHVLDEQIVLELDSLRFNVCHHPYADVDLRDNKKNDGSYSDKYEKWRPIDDGNLLLCGHIHERWKTKKSPKGSLMINVGVDVWDMKPVSLEEIKATIFENN